jgi:hypothetical protein
MVNKKRTFLLFLLLSSAFCVVSAQRIFVVAMMPLEATGVNPEEAANITRQIIAELNSWGTLNVIQQEAGADYIVQGSLSRQGLNFLLSAQTIDAGTQRVLNESRELAATLADLSIFSFSSQIVEHVPFPNYLLGIWQSTINMPDGPVVCIIEFRADRTVRVERYDTWEHRQNNSLRYEGFGTGTYTYAGYHSRRAMTINNQQVQIDAMAGFNLRLEETLPEQTNVNIGRLGLVFSADRNSFQILGGSLPAGRNYDGPSVHPSASIGFTQFTKIR